MNVTYNPHNLFPLRNCSKVPSSYKDPLQPLSSKEIIVIKRSVTRPLSYLVCSRTLNKTYYDIAYNVA